MRALLDKMATDLNAALKRATKLGKEAKIKFDPSNLVLEQAREVRTDLSPKEDNKITNIKGSNAEFVADETELSVIHPIEPMQKYKTDILNTEVSQLQYKLNFIRNLKEKAFPIPESEQKSKIMQDHLKEIRRIGIKNLRNQQNDNTMPLNAGREIYEAKDAAMAAKYGDSFIDQSKTIIETTIQL